MELLNRIGIGAIIKDKLLIMSNLSFCHNVFKSRLPHGRQKVYICWKGLKTYNKSAVDDFETRFYVNIWKISIIESTCIVCVTCIDLCWNYLDMVIIITVPGDLFYPFSHITNLLQTFLKASLQNYGIVLIYNLKLD